jgi:hypothetical protein
MADEALATAPRRVAQSPHQLRNRSMNPGFTVTSRRSPNSLTNTETQAKAGFGEFPLRKSA